MLDARSPQGRLGEEPLADPACTRCPLAATARSVCVPGEGDLNGTLLVLGIAPGYNEDEQNRPFVGKAGRVLRSVLAENGLEARLENVARCRPPENRDPTAAEATACRVYLERVVSQMPHLKFVVALGAIPMHAMDVPGGITKLAGVPRPVYLFGKHLTVIPVIHPAGLMRSPKNKSTWLSHWHQIRQIVHPPQKTVADSIGAVLLVNGLEGRDWRTL